jgi:hypothetical protein
MTKEAKSCQVLQCRVRDDPEATVFRPAQSRLPDENEPVCETQFQNQFTKWVYWRSRYVDSLDMEITDGPDGWRTAKQRRGTEAWGTSGSKTLGSHRRRRGLSNYVVLDVDQRRGRGPETVTFHNVPPGTYQVAVDQFSKDSLLGNDNIKDGAPYVTIYLGGGQVAFDCAIPPECEAVQAVWNVVDIKIEAAGVDVDGTNKYSIRLIDDPAKMTKLWSINKPASDDAETVSRYIPWRLGVMYPKREAYFKATITEYTDSQLQNVCYGKCKASPGTKGFDGCLDHR